MTKQEFMDQLRHKLLEKGLPKEVCDQKCKTISTGFEKMPPEEAGKLFTTANLNMLVDRVATEATRSAGAKATDAKTSAAAKSSSEAKEAGAATEKPVLTDDSVSVEKDSQTSQNDAQKPTIVINRSNTKSDKSPTASTVEKPSKSSDVVVVSAPASRSGGSRTHRPTLNDDLMSEGSHHPKLLLTLMAILCAPMLITVVLAALGISLSLAVCMAGIILVVVSVIAAVVCAGSLLSAVGLIYGISQIISEPRYVGLHEIGLAMVFAGITILVSVVLYNVAVRFIPFIYKVIGAALKSGFKKLKELAVLAWKGCVNL